MSRKYDPSKPNEFMELYKKYKHEQELRKQDLISKLMDEKIKNKRYHA